MGGKDDDGRSDFDRFMADFNKEMADTRKELERVMEEMRAELPSPHDALEDLRKQREKSGNNEDKFQRGPFEKFKGFIDSNFALLSDGFKNFPSNVKELKERMKEEREARREEEIDIWRRWTGSNDSPDHIRMEVERASKDDKKSVTEATFMLLRESFERNRHVSPQKILDLYRDDEWSFGSLDQFATPMLSFGGACYYKSETVENLPSTARWGWPVATQRWLGVDWFKRSPYSPIRLEAIPDLGEKGGKWRAAFEDLLLVSLDKPMQTTEKIGQRIGGKPQSTYHGPGLDWMLSLQCRGILPPQLPNLYRHYRQEHGRDWFKPAHTRIISDLDAITSQRSHCMYPRAEADITALMDEVGIQAQPETDAFSQPRLAGIEQSPWQVPDTEQDLYDQMQPQLPQAPQTEEPQQKILPGLSGRDKDKDLFLMTLHVNAAVSRRDYTAALAHVSEFEDFHGRNDGYLDRIIFSMSDDELDEFYHIGSRKFLADVNSIWPRFTERIDLHDRWAMAFERAEKFGIDLSDAHASGLPLEDVEADLDEAEFAARESRTERALERAERLGYDFQNWDWRSLPLEELEAELEREEKYSQARVFEVLTKAKRMGYDFEGWEWRGLPVWELEGELERMEAYALRDGATSSGSPRPSQLEGTGTAKPVDVLSQLTTTETTRLPDGTVTTKVVLKRRFADGREEVSESLHTGNEGREAEAGLRERGREDAEGAGRREGKGSGKGWFWT